MHLESGIWENVKPSPFLKLQIRKDGMFLVLGVQFPAWDIVSEFALRVYLRAKGTRRG
jgi:hypothetical protein